MCMFLDDAGHVQWSGLTEYCNGAEAAAWKEKFGAGVPEAGRATLNEWVAAKLAYDANRKPGDPLAVGIVEAHKAWLDEALKTVEPQPETPAEDASDPMDDFNYVGSKHHY